jgi:hypothetical protein
MMLWAGDINNDHLIRYNGAMNDKNEVLKIVGLTTPNNVVFGYYKADLNLDGMVRYNGGNNDKNEILKTVGLTSPNNVVIEQLPK